MSAEITIISRRGGIEQRRMPRKARMPADPFGLEVERAIHKEIARQGMWERYRKGEGEFEPAFFCATDDFFLLQEMASDPYLRFFYGQRTPSGGWVSFWDEHGNQWVKVVPHPQADFDHVEQKMKRWGDNRVNLTHGEQEEIKRQANGNRLKEEELAMDHRSASSFGWDDLGFHTIPFDLPNLPENVEIWINGSCWPKYNLLHKQLVAKLHNMVEAHKAEGDNRKREVKEQRRKEQEELLNELWKKFWKWWMDVQGRAKARAEARSAAAGASEIDGVPIRHIFFTELPLTRKQVNSLKMIFETFREKMGFETPVMRFWADTKCTKCDTERRMLLNLSTKVAFCKICGEITAEVLEFESHDILDDGPPEPDWWEVAEELRSRINALYAEGEDLSVIKRLERRLHFIEVEHIKLVDHNNLFYADFTVDERFV